MTHFSRKVSGLSNPTERAFNIEVNPASAPKSALSIGTLVRAMPCLLLTLPKSQLPLPAPPRPMRYSLLLPLLAMHLTILLLSLAINTTAASTLSRRFLDITTAINATTTSNATISINSTASCNATSGDSFILNFVLTLEYLQRAFYESGLANFTESDFANAGFEETFYSNLQQIHFDEQSHVSFLRNTLVAANIQPTAALAYEFPYTDVSSFVALAAVLKGVGVSA
ncbi:hypothetical protein N7G274_002392 [Stereocaulon virgatum]|uniref:Uncharacterized protein n=1 Tax=Stereocaulon virgatum TaxID=373712 RepID=A0ABR4AIK0_9LECA